MTIPTRPAPVPPQMHNFNSHGGATAADDANARLEQLRLQLQQQQQQQQQQKLTIKLPPPPKGNTNLNMAATNSTFPIRNNHNQNFNEFGDGNNGASSITRKFPKVRYAPTTNWNDSPFDMNPSQTTTTTTTTTMNGNNKKVPPPRPPPPKVSVNGNQKITTSSSSNILTNIFHRKKTTSVNNTKQQSAARLYGVSSGNYAINPTATNSSYESTTTSSSSSFTNTDWNSAWNTTSNNVYSSSSTIMTSQNNQDGQLISFDSPPSSPTFTQKSNSDCVSVDSFSSDSNFSSPQNGSVSQPESGFEDDFSGGASRSRPATTSPLDPWETFDVCGGGMNSNGRGYSSETAYCSTANIGTAPVRNLNARTNNTAVQDNPLCNGKSLLPPTTSLYMPTIIKPKISQKPKAPKPPTFRNNIAHQQAAGIMNLPTPPSPPMPQCAPPPPPSLSGGVNLLDVISGKVDPIHLSNVANNYSSTSINETAFGIALYDFDGAEEGDLSFRENEKIYLLEMLDSEWYRGRTRSGCEGIFPANYIDVKIPLSTTSSETAAAAVITPAVPTSKLALHKVRCLYNFPADVDGDLALKENDIVTILYKINEDWLFGEINNKKGQFPANFLEYIPTNIPLP